MRKTKQAMQSNTRNLLIYFGILSILCVLLIEAASHIILKHNDQGANTESSSRHVFHPYRRHALNPQYNRAFDSSGNKIHSDDGFRSDTPFSKDKPDDVFRIIMLGGSTMYGIGATDVYPHTPTLNNDQTISHYLEAEINKYLAAKSSSKRVEIINAAVTAYTTFEHLVYFNEVLYEYSPDLLVFLDGHNDFYYYKQYNNWHHVKQGTPKLTYHFNKRSLWFTGISVARYFAQFSRFFMLVEKYMMRVWENANLDQFPQTAFPRTLAGDFPENVDAVLKETIFKTYIQFKALGELFNFDLIVFLQPQVVLENKALLSDADQHIQSLTLKYDTNTRRNEIRPYFPDLFRQYGLAFVDISEIASASYANEQLYTDYCHLTPKGSEAVATQMLPHLTRFLDN